MPKTYEAINKNIQGNSQVSGSMLEVEQRQSALINMLADIWNIPGSLTGSLNLNQKSGLFRAEDGSSLKSGKMRMPNSRYGNTPTLNGVLEVAVAFDQADEAGKLQSTKLQILMPGENGQAPKPHYLTYDKANEKFIIGDEVKAPENPKMPKKPGRWDRFLSHFTKNAAVEKYRQDMAAYNEKKAAYDQYAGFCQNGSKLQGDIESAKQKAAEAKKAKNPEVNAPEKAVAAPESQKKAENVNPDLEKYNAWVDATCEQFPSLKEIGQNAKAGMKHLAAKGNIKTFNDLFSGVRRDNTLNAMGSVTLFNLALAAGLGNKEGKVFDSSQQAAAFVTANVCKNEEFRHAVMGKDDATSADPKLFNDFVATKGMNIARSFPKISKTMGEKFASVEKNSEIKTKANPDSQKMVEGTKEYKMIR